MRHLRYEPASAPDYFASGERYFNEALKDEDLDPSERVMAVTMRARCLIELERHADVAPSLAVPLPSYTTDRNYPGDIIGLSLLKASKLDPERAYAEAAAGGKEGGDAALARPPRLGAGHVLQRIGTPEIQGGSDRICAAHAGKIDFDVLKKDLETP